MPRGTPGRLPAPMLSFQIASDLFEREMGIVGTANHRTVPCMTYIASLQAGHRRDFPRRCPLTTLT